MNYQNKQFVIDTLMKLADSSPVKKTYPSSIYNSARNSYDISQHELDIWVNYVNSVLDILSSYINQTELSLIKLQIRNIASQNELTSAMRALNIERELLNLAQNILRYYQ
ncbi:MAG: hypothetical protein K2O45_13075 [Oscillospiraceae bacterium]|nr:hypothetical protein [Oscillospiraceae bacterium]